MQSLDESCPEHRAEGGESPCARVQDSTSFLIEQNNVKFGLFLILCISVI